MMQKGLALVVLCLAVSACSNAPGVGSQAPDFAAVDNEGRTVSRAEYAGKVTVYYFWATWSAPCFESTRALQRLYEVYQGRADVVAVHYNTVGNAAEYYADAELTFRMVPDGTPIVEAFGIKDIPTVVIVDKNGSVVHNQVGFATGDEKKLDGIIAAALSE